jgi:hypothetical protein
MKILTNRPVRKYYVLSFAIIIPLLLTSPIIVEYFERAVGRITDPALNSTVDVISLIIVAIFTVLNLRGFIKLVRQQTASLVIPWITIILSALTLAAMIITGQ